MKNQEIYDKWTEFINDDKYNKYFLSEEQMWVDKLSILKKYIDDNNKYPSHGSKNIETRKLG